MLWARQTVVPHVPKGTQPAPELGARQVRGGGRVECKVGEMMSIEAVGEM